MDDVNSMFGGDAEAVDVPVVEQVVEQVEAPVEAPIVEQVVEPVVEKPQVPDGYVPVSVVKELRDEIRALKTPPVQETPQEELYPDEDTLKIVNGSLRQQAMQFSRTLVEDKYGSDVVDTAYKWAFERCNDDPAFNMAVANSPHPFKFIVEEHRKAQSLQELGSIDPETVKAFKQWQAAQAQVTPAVPQPTVPIPPRSIASEPSAGGNTPPPKVTPEEERLGKMF